MPSCSLLSMSLDAGTPFRLGSPTMLRQAVRRNARAIREGRRHVQAASASVLPSTRRSPPTPSPSGGTRRPLTGIGFLRGHTRALAYTAFVPFTPLLLLLRLFLGNRRGFVLLRSRHALWPHLRLQNAHGKGL